MQASIKIEDIFMQLQVPITVYNSRHPVKDFNTDAWCRAVPGCHAAAGELGAEPSSGTKAGSRDGGWDLLMAAMKTNWRPMLFLPPGERAAVKCSA